MKIEINFLKQKNNTNTLIFCDEYSKIFGLEKTFSKISLLNLKKFIISEKSLEKKNQKTLVYNLNPNQKIIIYKINKPTNRFDNEKAGSEVFNILRSNKIKEINIFEENIKFFSKDNNIFINEFLHGLKLKSYYFNKYKTDIVNKKIKILLALKIKKQFEKNDLKFFSLYEGIKFTKDLVSEPGNVLYPDEYVKRILELRKLNLKIHVLDKVKMKKLGMNALIGVGQGSSKGSYLVTIEWNGLNKKSKPVAFVGKGVCFDTGGISLKPAKFMEDMTYDMAGSAVVVGLMKNLALRKAKVNAVGVVGLVENMPDGNAQRPGDIVKSYSGKTIEILNTDAEGRLVLADALSYTEKKFKPNFIVDLATLTGAIIVSLGSEYAGLFSNNDKISDQLFKAGEKVGEKVWRMPLNDNYDKLIDSKKADMQNINYVGGAGSTTAAQFLQRFILNKTPWAHLDIAGMAFSKYGGALNSGGATGYGVRLLNQLIEDNYE
jgi:leucyl aminopeptidase